jgi:hypothetical protein
MPRLGKFPAWSFAAALVVVCCRGADSVQSGDAHFSKPPAALSRTLAANGSWRPGLRKFGSGAGMLGRNVWENWAPPRSFFDGQPQSAGCCGVMKLRGGGKSKRDKVMDVRDGINGGDGGNEPDELDGLYAGPGDLSESEGVDADEWVNSEFERSSGGTWNEKAAIVADQVSDDGPSRSGEEEDEEDEGKESDGEVSSRMKREKRKQEVEKKKKRGDSMVGAVEGGVVLKPSRSESKHGKDDVKEGRKEEKEKNGKKRSRERDSPDVQDDSEGEGGETKSKGKKKKKSKTGKNAGSAEALVTPWDDRAKPNAKVMISSGVENNTEVEGGYFTRWVVSPPSPSESSYS